MMKNLYPRTEQSSSAQSLTLILLQHALCFLQINYCLINFTGSKKLGETLGGFVTP